MLTADRIRRAWKDIVEAHVADVAFVSVWTAFLDDKQELRYPAAIWRPVTTSAIPTDSFAIEDTFAASVAFVDQTATDRTADARDRAHDRMDAIARQCWYRFHDLYIANTGTVDGVTVDFAPDATPTFSPAYDATDKHVTGVTMEVTLRARPEAICLTDYFS